ncbi:MAG TPA: ribosome biogenesis GTP-binding protein YihA/YsxC [Verrucomicrobiae bacterium]|nr:ribosome biogenesis GTP-binding protein YihA/YsxC [Verrucomicrobiae bacterium]
MKTEPLRIATVTFVKSAVTPAHYPEGELPEIAFAGRSNVGKSTLINVLVNRKNLVRTSSTPGRTQLINFFQVDDSFMLVDLPGYGYAKVPPEVRKSWGPMMQTYLSRRENLRGVVLIIDIRRIPGGEDLQMLDWLRSYGIPCIIVATKVDKVSKNERARQRAAIAKAMGVAAGDIVCFSSLSREGKEDALARIAAVLQAADLPAEPVP